MSEAELLIRKTETLPSALFEEAVHYIDYLSQKAQSAFHPLRKKIKKK